MTLMMSPRVVSSWLLLAVPCAWLYAPVITKLVHDWAHDENYSHGFLIVPLAAWFAWRQRDRLTAARQQPSVVGLLSSSAALWRS